MNLSPSERPENAEYKADRVDKLRGFLGNTHCSYFALISHFFLQKAKTFIHFTGFSIWEWEMDLGFR